jgi:hypothetical protein
MGCVLAMVAACGPSTPTPDESQSSGGTLAESSTTVDVTSEGTEVGPTTEGSVSDSTSSASESDSTTDFVACPDIHEGDLIVDDSTDLESVRTIRAITGSLSVTNFSGTELQSLGCLRTVDGDVNIYDNPNLATLSGLAQLGSIGLGLNVSRNPMLTSLDGVGHIESLPSVSLWSNASLAQMGLNNVEQIITLSIGSPCTTDDQPDPAYDNPNLTAIDGLEDLRSLGDVQIGSQSGLVSLSRLHDLAGRGFIPNHSFINHNSNLPYEQVELLEDLGAEVDSCGSLGEPVSHVCYCPK